PVGHRGRRLVAPQSGPARLPAASRIAAARGPGEAGPMKSTIAILALTSALAASAEAGVAAVWAVNDGEKVEQDDLAHPAKARNSAWDGRTVRLFGAGNEVLAVQVVVESDAKGIAALSASLPDLRRRGGPDRGRAPGTDEGSITLKADGQARVVPVALELMAFALPDENSMNAMVYYEPDQPELYQGRNLDDTYHRFAHRQRVELVHAYDETKVRGHPGRFGGADFTKARGYEGPGEGVGNRIAPVSFYGPGRGWEDRPTAWRRADAWMTFLATV